jgi:hypothetical protein
MFMHLLNLNMKNKQFTYSANPACICKGTGILTEGGTSVKWPFCS